MNIMYIMYHNGTTIITIYILYHENLEKRGSLLGNPGRKFPGRVARSVAEPWVWLGSARETPSQISQLFKTLMVV